jgi:hypothetical protein
MAREDRGAPRPARSLGEFGADAERTQCSFVERCGGRAFAYEPDPYGPGWHRNDENGQARKDATPDQNRGGRDADTSKKTPSPNVDVPGLVGGAVASARVAVAFTRGLRRTR